MLTTTATRTYGQRIAGFAIAVILAAAAGLAVGSALNSWAEAPDRTATAGFSVQALDAVRVTRGDVIATSDNESDYALRHRPASPKAAPSTQRAPGVPHPN